MGSGKKVGRPVVVEIGRRNLRPSKTWASRKTNPLSGSAILEARKKAGLTAAEIASAVGRSSAWFGMAESGLIPLTPESEKIILTVISRLQRFNITVNEARAKVLAGLHLPPTPPKRGHPRPGGSHAA
jgi:hypothetical protein